MKKLALALFLIAGCAAPATQMEACPASGCPKPAVEPGHGATGEPGVAPTKLQQQAAFDLQCAQEKLAFTPLGTDHWYAGLRAWGVRGCGKQASYAVQSSCANVENDVCNWLLNSPIQPVQ